MSRFDITGLFAMSGDLTLRQTSASSRRPTTTRVPDNLLRKRIEALNDAIDTAITTQPAPPFTLSEWRQGWPGNVGNSTIRCRN